MSAWVWVPVIWMTLSIVTGLVLGKALHICETHDRQRAPRRHQ